MCLNTISKSVYFDWFLTHFLGILFFNHCKQYLIEDSRRLNNFSSWHKKCKSKLNHMDNTHDFRSILSQKRIYHNI